MAIDANQMRQRALQIKARQGAKSLEEQARGVKWAEDVIREIHDNMDLDQYSHTVPVKFGELSPDALAGAIDHLRSLGYSYSFGATSAESQVYNPETQYRVCISWEEPIQDEEEAK